MVWPLTTLHIDSVLQLSSLLRDPVYRGATVLHGRGEPVLLIPGFLVGDWTLWVMAGWLSRIGYRPYLSGIDWNVGPPERTAQLLSWRLSYIVKETGQPVLIVGHSLGGILARFLGSRMPKQVAGVVALGSPLHDPLGGTSSFVRILFHSLQQLWGLVGYLPPDPDFFRSVCVPLPPEVPFTAIYSKHDEVVDWHSCLDAQGTNIEVNGYHIGLIVNTEVYRALAHVLAAASSHRQRRGSGAH